MGDQVRGNRVFDTDLLDTDLRGNRVFDTDLLTPISFWCIAERLELVRRRRLGLD